MDDDNMEDPTESFEFRSASSRPGDPDADPDLEDESWTGVGARRGPRQPAEGVRIIGADEAAAAIESGQIASKKPDDALRFGDVPPQPAGPRPSLRFPGADPASVSKPPVAEPPPQERPPPFDPVRSWDEALRSAEARGRPPAAAADLFPDDEPDDFFSFAREDEGRRPPPPPDGGSAGSGSGRSWFDDDNAIGSSTSGPTVEPPSGSTPLPHWTEPPSGEVPRILVDDEEPPAQDDDLNAWSSLAARPRWRDQPTDWEEADFDDALLADEQPRMGALQHQDDSSPFSFDDFDAEEAPPPPPEPASRPGPSGRARISTLPTGGGSPLGPPGGGRSQGASRDLSNRVLTGAIAAGVLLVAAAIGPGALVFLIAIVLTMASAEMYKGLRVRGYHPATLLGLVGTPAMVGAVYWRGLDAFPLVLALFVVFTLLWYLTGVVRAGPAMNVAVTLMAFLYVSFLGSFAALLLTAPNDLGIGLLLGAILATVTHDIGSYFVGRWAGKTPLAPAISPNKTVEGLVGGTLATILMCVVVVRVISPWDGGKAFALALVVSVAAPLGDLCESMIKRDLGVKDMGTVLPGHGGVLDRIDAMLFVLPATYYLVRILTFS